MVCFKMLVMYGESYLAIILCLARLVNTKGKIGCKRREICNSQVLSVSDNFICKYSIFTTMNVYVANPCYNLCLSVCLLENSFIVILLLWTHYSVPNHVPHVSQQREKCVSMLPKTVLIFTHFLYFASHKHSTQ